MVAKSVGALVLTVSVAAATAFVVLALMVDPAVPSRDGPRADGPHDVAAGPDRPEVQRSEVVALRGRVAELERRLGVAERQLGARRAAASRVEVAPAAGPADGRRTLGEGTVFISADAVERLLRRSRAAVVSTPDAPRRSVAEIAADLGVDAGLRPKVEAIVRAHEEEIARLVLGDGTMDELRARVVEGQADAERMAALEQTMSENSLANFGRIVHASEALREKLEPVVGKDRAEKFVARKRDPSIDVVVAAYVDVE